MLKLKKVAVTGGIASGKTTVCRYFKELGAYVVSADAIVHELLLLDRAVKKDVIELVGEEVVDKEGNLNRQAIAEKVFRDPTLLEKLEKRVHPEVQKVIETQYQKATKLNALLFVVEVPLLFEGSHAKYYDKTIAVTASKEKRMERATETGTSQDEFLNRENRQFSTEKKASLADLVIQNNGSLKELQNQVKSIFKSLTEGI